jgi:hypothetical protein
MGGGCCPENPSERRRTVSAKSMRPRWTWNGKELTFLEPFWRLCLSPAAEAIRGGLPSAVLVVEFCSSQTCDRVQPTVGEMSSRAQ